MFVHPATHHFSRTYTSQNAGGHPTTSRKNLNKENAGALPSKTPSRMTAKGAVPGTSMRVGLGVKSTVKDGNVQHAGGGGGDGRGKGREEDIGELDQSSTRASALRAGPKRLFTSHASSSKSTLPPSKSLSSLPSINPLPTRTPAARRQQPANLRTPAPPAFEPPTPLPSASRTRRRSRQSLTPLKANHVEFKTPARSAKWEEEVSLGSIEIGAELEEVVEVDEGDGDDEVEYMPPPMPELPPEPPFEHADLKHAFGILANVPPLWRIGEAVIEVPELEPDFEPVQDVQLMDEDMLEEPLFRKARPDAGANAAPSTGSKVNAAVPTRKATTAGRSGAIAAPMRHTGSRAALATTAASRMGPGVRAGVTASSSTISTTIAARKPPVPAAARAAPARPTTGVSKSVTASSMRTPATAARVPATIATARPRPGGVSTSMAGSTVPSATRVAATNGTASYRPGGSEPPAAKVDTRPIIKIDLPAMELEDDFYVEADVDFDLGLSSDEDAEHAKSARKDEGTKKEDEARNETHAETQTAEAGLEAVPEE